MKRLSALAGLTAAVLVACAGPALAAAPPQAPAPIVSYGFESAYPSYLDVDEYYVSGDPATEAWWGRITGSKYSGSYGLWCAGVGGSWGSEYPESTRGTATFDVPQLADYYSSEVSFRYIMRNAGAWDWFITRWSDNAYSTSPGWDVNYEAISSGWTLRTHDLASTSNDWNLSRTSGDVQFFFFDRYEPTLVSPKQGQGAVIDDVTIAGYKYGPVRGLTAEVVGDEVRLDWAKPYRAVGSTSVEERSVTYRVWRARGIGPTFAWTELTSGRITGTEFVDGTAGGLWHTYLVQAWDTGSGTGYGESVTTAAGEGDPPPPGQPPVADEYTPVPIEGPTRYETAIEASKLAFPNGAETVVVTTGENWPDALGGSALAGAYGGPILLTPSSALPAAVAAEIDRLGAADAIILGGTGAVTPAVEAALAARLGPTRVRRIGGADRYATAELIARAVTEKAGAAYDGTALVATGANFPDALGGSPLAAGGPWPILLATPAGLTPSTAATLDDIGVDRALILGGTGVVSPAVEAGLAGALGADEVTRLAGPDRYATAVEIACWAVKTEQTFFCEGTGFATGENFPDALAGGVVQGRLRAPLLLTRSASLPPVVANALAEQADEMATVHFYGGPGAIAQGVRDQIAGIIQ
jgi:putative cell wall-binding protein